MTLPILIATTMILETGTDSAQILTIPQDSDGWMTVTIVLAVVLVLGLVIVCVGMLAIVLLMIRLFRMTRELSTARIALRRARESRMDLEERTSELVETIHEQESQIRRLRRICKQRHENTDNENLEN